MFYVARFAALIWFAYFLPWAVAEGVWWLGRRGNNRTRAQQVADAPIFMQVVQWDVPTGWMAAGFVASFLLIAGVISATR